jgi:hypothetical protein
VPENPRDCDGNNGVCGRADLNIADGHHILYRVCTTNNGYTVACTGYLSDIA